MTLTEQDLRHLRRCVALAEESLNEGDQPFGSVLVSAEGAVLAEDHQFCAGNPVLLGRGGIARRRQPPLFPPLLLNWLSIQWFTKLST